MSLPPRPRFAREDVAQRQEGDGKLHRFEDLSYPLSCRVGDSVTNIITPLMVYFPLVLTFCQRWRTDFGLGSLTAAMLPYSFWLLLVGIGLTFSWVYLDLPLGPGAVVEYTLPAPPVAPAP